LKIAIPYKPRPGQAQLHAELATHRWAVVVCHRRWGKTVMAINHLLRDAIMCQQGRPRFHYISPTYRQAKMISWDYVKEFAAKIPGVKFNETELRCDLPNGARITLLGGDDPSRLRGIYSDGVVMDEVADMPETVFPEVIRPALADRGGYAIFIGTPRGHNAFFDLWQLAESEKGWYRAMFKASDTNILSNEELEAARSAMTSEQYDQEFECSFTAANPGSIFGRELQRIDEKGQVCHVPYDPALRVDTHFDLGISDATAIWFTQSAGRGATHVIDYFEARGEGLPFYARVLDEKNYLYGTHHAPHDIEVREMGSGKSRREIAYDLGINFRVVPKLPIEDGLHAAKLFLSRCWFDRENCAKGLDALRFYHRKYDERNRTFRTAVTHDWSSHAADAFRYASVALRDSDRSGIPPQNFANSAYDPFKNYEHSSL
tara:strand:+ start:842 stop:2137 length:1296 start_codon:yes stop_codon:yes gene_type:complete